MASFVNNCLFNATSTGTGDFVVATAVTGSQKPVDAGAVNGAIYRYYAYSSDKSQWEVGYGAYTTGTVTLARTTVLYNSADTGSGSGQSGAGSKISFSTVPLVAIVTLNEDLVFINPPQGRICLQTAEPVPAVTRSAKTTILYTPYQGNQIPIYDGTSFRNVVFSEISVATTDTAKSPAAIGASKVNDWFIWDDAGTTRIGHGPDWTSDTVRSAGTALVLVNGIYLNNAALTNGPAASRGTYVGTTRSNASSQLDWIFGSSAAGGGAAFLGVWNMYNRVSVSTTVTDSNTPWVTATSATPGPLDVGGAGSGLNNRISAVHGLAEDGIRIAFGARLSGVTVAFAGVDAGFAMDATTAFDKQIHSQSTSGGVQIVVSCSCENSYAPQLGFHFWQATQAGDGTNAGTVAGGSLGGFSGLFMM